jgi:hypothetical protein
MPREEKTGERDEKAKLMMKDRREVEATMAAPLILFLGHGLLPFCDGDLPTHSWV